MSAAESQPPEMRIGNQEREEAVEILGRHHASGRLTVDEYSGRVAHAWEARTAQDLLAIFRDLPEPHPRVLSALRPPPRAGAVPGMADPYAPFGREPMTGRPYSERSKIVAGLLQIFLPFGIGRFYSGHFGIAIAQLLVTIFTLGLGALWPFIDGIVLLAGNPDDPNGFPMRS